MHSTNLVPIAAQARRGAARGRRLAARPVRALRSWCAAQAWRATAALVAEPMLPRPIARAFAGGSRHAHRIAAALVLAASPWTTSIAAADSLILRSAVRARSDDGVVLLRDVAELRGEEIARFAELVVAAVPMGAPAKEIGVEEIRRRLEEAGANWAKIDLEGRRVVVRPRLSEAFEAPRVCAPASVEPSKSAGRTGANGAGSTDDDHGAASSSSASSGGANGSPGSIAAGAARNADGAPSVEPRRFDPTRGPRRSAAEPVLAAAVIGEHSVRALVLDAMLRELGEEPESLRATFDGLDAATLAEIPTHLRIEIEPIGRIDGDRAEFAVRWWRDGRVERRTNLSAFPEVARIAAVAARDLRKGDRPGDADLTSAICWLPPADRARVVRPGAAGGRALAIGLRAGEPLLDSRLEKQLLVKRGDRIIVRSIVGSLAVSVDAVAQSDGREGELIECVRVGTSGRSKSSFNALVTARGEAVVVQAGSES